MNRWNVELLNNVNGIRFGMDRAEARKIVGTDYTEFKKSKFSKNTTDDFGICHIFYDSNDTVEAIEIFGDIEVAIDEQIVFPNGLDNLKKIAEDLVDDGDGLISIKYSVGVTMDGDRMEGILFAGQGYYS